MSHVYWEGFWRRMDTARGDARRRKELLHGKQFGPRHPEIARRSETLVRKGL